VQFNDVLQLHFRVVVSHLLRTLYLHESDLACVRSSDRACELPLGKTVGLSRISGKCVYFQSGEMSSAAMQFSFMSYINGD
jgi:hypothetical protein